MEDKKKPNQQQDFIVETPVIVEEKVKIDGKIFIRKYERGKFLGKGGFAKCYEMRCVETKKVYAAKLFEKKALANTKSRKKLINEIKLHKKLHHQHIVNFEHFFEDKEHVYILLELCSNQTLNELLKRRKRLTEIEVQCYVIQIVRALKYIHNHKVIHRDLKLGNLFMNSKLELKLGDFGLAAKIEYEGQRRKTVCGTPNYIAPEILEKKNGHSYEVDVWSLGVIIYTLLYGRPPYETADVKLTYKRIKINNYTFPESIKIHYTAKKLISSILNLDPSKRPTLDQILESDFFKLYSSVPHSLPISTLACPPSGNYVNSFLKKEGGLYSTINNLTNSMSNINVNYLEYPNNNSKFNNQTINTNIIHRKSGSCVDLNTPQNKEGASLNVLTGQLVSNNRFIEEEEKKGDYNTIEENFNKINKLNEEHNMNELINEFENEENNKTNVLYNSASSRVVKYFDYTNKFGIVYLISSDCNYIGICFNDFSTIIQNSNLALVDNKNKLLYNYFDKDRKNVANFDEAGLDSLVKSKNINKELSKKCEIMKQIVQKYSNEVGNLKPLYGNIDYNNYNLNRIVILKDFLKVQQAILLRLSNKLVQIAFADQTEILMSTESTDFIYRNKNGEETFDSIQNVMASDSTEVIKRIKFSKNLMLHFVKTFKSVGNVGNTKKK